MSDNFPKDEQIVNLADYMTGVMTREELESYVFEDLYHMMSQDNGDLFWANINELRKEPEDFLHENYEVDRGGLSE